MKLLYSLLALGGAFTATAHADPTNRPDPAVEARTVQELLATKKQLQAKRLYPRFAEDFANAFARLGRTDLALREADFASPQSVSGQPTDFTSDQVLKTAVERRASLHDFAGAEALTRRIKSPIVRVQSWLTLGRGWLAVGNKTEARRALFQVSPLATNPRTLGNTAYLLNRSGDRSAASRLIVKALAAIKSGDEDGISVNGVGTDLYVENVALKMGFLQEWLDYNSNRPVLSYRQRYILMKLGRFDLAIAGARAVPAEEKVSALTQVAIAQLRLKNDRPQALELVQEAEAAFLAPPISTDANDPFASTTGQTEMRRSSVMELAQARHLLGDKIGEQKWASQIADGLPPARAEFFKAYYDYQIQTLVLRITDNPTPEQVVQLSALLVPKRSLFVRDRDGLNIITGHIRRQIAAKQFESARFAIKALEPLALESQKRDLQYDLNAPRPIDYASEILSLWATSNDDKSARQFVQKLVASPVAQKNLGGFAVLLFENGFVDAALKMLPPDIKIAEEPELLPALAQGEPYAHPHSFPTWFNQISDPSDRAQALIEYSTFLTLPLFQLFLDESWDY